MRNYPSVYYRGVIVRGGLDDNQQIICHLYSVDNGDFFTIIAKAKLCRTKRSILVLNACLFNNSKSMKIGNLYANYVYIGSGGI